MNTIEIRKILTGLFQHRNIKFDVLASDELKTTTLKQYPIALVVNTKPSSHPGEHWTAIFIRSRNQPMVFFCSYGMGMESYSNDFSDFGKLFKSIVQNKIQLQSLNSNVCGHFAIYFLWKQMNNVSLNSIYCGFSKDYHKNDKLVRDFVTQKNHLLSSFCKHKNNINQISINFKT